MLVVECAVEERLVTVRVERELVTDAMSSELPAVVFVVAVVIVACGESEDDVLV